VPLTSCGRHLLLGRRVLHAAAPTASARSAKASPASTAASTERCVTRLIRCHPLDDASAVTCSDAMPCHPLDTPDKVEGLVPSGAWGFKSPLRHERMFDSPPEVSMNLGCFRVKST
jgi:hypothetical protein